MKKKNVMTLVQKNFFLNYRRSAKIFTEVQQKLKINKIVINFKNQ